MCVCVGVCGWGWGGVWVAIHTLTMAHAAQYCYLSPPWSGIGCDCRGVHGGGEAVSSVSAKNNICTEKLTYIYFTYWLHTVHVYILVQ